MTRKNRKMSRQEIPVTTLAILLALMGVSVSPPLTLATSAQAASPVTDAPPPTAVPQNPIVRINGSGTMTNINQALGQGFKAKFPEAQVETAAEGEASALKAVAEGRADLAAIGRPLTETEKAQGFATVPVAKNRVAVVVGANNPFSGDLTAEQFAQIFRGELTNWSALGAPAAPIRLIDRPETSDIRRSLQAYPLFQTTSPQPGSNIVKLSQDSTEAMIQALGADGIGYAVPEQVAGNPNVRVLTIYGTLPTEANYAFSQPLFYAYRGTPSATTQAFLDYATAPENQQTIEAARAIDAARTSQSSPTGAVVSNPVTETAPATPFDGLPRWLWLLALPLVGGLLWWLFKEQEMAAASDPAPPASDRHPNPPQPAATGSAATPPATTTQQDKPSFVPPVVSQTPARITLTPRDAQTAYIAWEAPEAAKASLRERGGEKLKLRVYDVTPPGVGVEPARTGRQYDCDEQRQEMHVRIPTADRDYVAEIGYLTGSGRWLSLAKSASVRFLSADQGNTASNGSASAGGSVGGSVGAAAASTQTLNSAPVSSTTPVSPNGTASAQSSNSMFPDTGSASNAAGDFTVAALEREVEPSFTRNGAAESVDRSSSTKPPAIEQNGRITLVPESPTTAYVSWAVSDEAKAALKEQGEQLVLRIHDVTALNIDYEPPHSTHDYPCEETDQDKHVTLPESDRDYLAELGYFTEDGRWLRLIRSVHARVSGESTAF